MRYELSEEVIRLVIQYQREIKKLHNTTWSTEKGRLEQLNVMLDAERKLYWALLSAEDKI